MAPPRKRRDDDQLALPGTPAKQAPADPIAKGELATSVVAPTAAPLTDRRPSAEDAPSKEFFIPIHGLVRLTDAEVQVVNHPAFQRLEFVRQLGQTHLVYRGATHNRFEHAIGTLHVAQQMVDAIERNRRENKKAADERWRLDGALRREETAFVRLAALLHDIGHLPVGHTLEDELGRLPAHDSIARLRTVLMRTEWKGTSHAPLGTLIDALYADQAIKAELQNPEGEALTASEILQLLVAKDPPVASPSVVEPFRVALCSDIVGNTICADLLDYLHRDWLHLGKPRYFDLRLFDYIEARRDRESSSSCLVINLRGGSRVRTDAITAILDLLESRYQLSEIALFHRTKLCAAGMLERIVAELTDATAGTDVTESLVDELLDASDDDMLTRLRVRLETITVDASPSRTARLDGAVSLTRKLDLRQLHKEFLTRFEYQLADKAQLVQDLFAGPADEADRVARARVGADRRLATVRLLEDDFGLGPGSIVMYCPPRDMNTKIADVRVLVHGSVHKLDEYEVNARDQGLTGGHLKAQKDRFRRLWRVMFAIDPNVRQDLEARNLLQLLGRYIELAVLLSDPPIGSVQEALRGIARELAAVPNFKFEGHAVRSEEFIAAQSARNGALFYPGGRPSLQLLFEP